MQVESFVETDHLACFDLVFWQVRADHDGLCEEHFNVIILDNEDGFHLYRCF